jgi:hypothetical protein
MVSLPECACGAESGTPVSLLMRIPVGPNERPVSCNCLRAKCVFSCCDVVTSTYIFLGVFVFLTIPNGVQMIAS